MTERMSEATWNALKQPMIDDTLDYEERLSVLAELNRARAEEERLAKRVAELESELAIKTGECKLIHERGMEAIREANRGRDDDDRIRRIVREEIRAARVPYKSHMVDESCGLFHRPLAFATWEDEP